MGRSNTNPILDIRMYQVEFAGGKVTELTTAELMYSWCNAEGNEYLLLYMLVDNQKDNKAISLLGQQVTVQGRQITCKTTAGWQIFCK